MTATDKLQQRQNSFWKEFQWDTTFEPYDDEYSDEIVIGVWRHQPEDPAEFEQALYLVKLRYDGTCWLQPNFLAPANTIGENELFPRVELTSCGCTLKYLNVRPIIDPADDPVLRDGNGLDYRIGRCGCWDFVCGNRRCVNRYFCGFVYVDRTLYRKILFTWDWTTKCWLSSGGVDAFGYAMPFDMTICLQSDGAGGCQLLATYGGYGGFTLLPIAVNDEDTVWSHTFNGGNADGTDFITLFVQTSFDGNCEDFTASCTDATPCADECGSHPAVLYVSMTGFSDPYDPPPTLTDVCTNEVEMIFYSRLVAIVDGVISYLCGYIGYSVVPSNWFNPATGLTEVEDQLLVFELNMAALTITRRRLVAPTTIINTDVVPVGETCVPYHGYFSSLDEFGARLTFCFFGDNRKQFYRYTLEITE
jgi:hypothetical protein